MPRSKHSEKAMDDRKLCVLTKLRDLPDVSFLELGFNATPSFLRNMAARGLVKITVAITPRGRDMIGALKDKAARRKVLIAKQRSKQLSRGQAA